MSIVSNFISQWKSIFKKEELPSSTFFKDQEGQWWFFGAYSNRFEDRQKEILSEQAHRDYAAWTRETGFQPALTFYHYPKMPHGFWESVFKHYGDNTTALQEIVDAVFKDVALGKVVRVVYLNGFSTVVAKIFPEKQHLAENLSDAKGIGMSHGFLALENSDRIYDQYRSFEMSILRSTRAANYFTWAGVRRNKEKDMAQKGLDKDDREWLLQFFTDEALTALEGSTKQMEEVIMPILKHKAVGTKVDVISETSEDTTSVSLTDTKVEVSPVEETPEAEVPETPAPVTSQTSEEVVALAAALNTTFSDLRDVLAEMQQKQLEAETKILEAENKIETLTKELENYQEKVKALEVSEDDKIAALIAPQDFRMGYSASRDGRNVASAKEKEDLMVEAPTGSTVAEPTFVDSVFWGPLMRNGRNR